MKEPWIGDIMVLLTAWSKEPCMALCRDLLEQGQICRHGRASIAIREIQNTVKEIKWQEETRS